VEEGRNEKKAMKKRNVSQNMNLFEKVQTKVEREISVTGYPPLTFQLDF